MNTAQRITAMVTTQDKCVLISQEHFTEVNIANRLNNFFSLDVVREAELDNALSTITELVPKLVVVDIDGLASDSVKRIYRIIFHLQIPCMIISSHSDILNHLRSEFDTKLVSYLPKGVLNTLFNESVSLLLNKVTQTEKIKKRIRSAAEYKHTKVTYLLAAALFLEPLIKIFYLKFKTDFSYEVIFQTILSMEGIMANFEFWCLFPLAGYALISVRSWSFLAFMALQTYALFSYFSYEEFTWPYVAKSPHISTSLMLVFNMALVCYFLIPEHIRPYWNRTRLIWRDTARFATVVKAKLKNNGEIFETTITNISETGAYFTSAEKFEIGHKMLMEIQINGAMKKFKAIIRREQDTAHDEFKGYGVEFLNITKVDKKELKSFIDSLQTRLQ